MQCRLCHADRELRNSHIVPEFLFANLYNDKGHMMGINGRGRKGWRPLQKGVTEKLFCESCEQFFNEYCEKPFKRQWIDASPLPKIWPQVEPIVVHVEYSSFKLFHLSVLFRASVSTLPTFEHVSLGPHEERIRNMLLLRQAGPALLYPIMGIALISPRDREITHLITMPVHGRFEGQKCYSLAYGGVNWWIAVSSHESSAWRSTSATEAGELPLVGMNWTELGVVKQASNLLRRADA